MSKITPFLWFQHGAEEAVTFYVSLFEDARIVDKDWIEDAPGPPEGVTVIDFELAGQRFTAIDGGEQPGFVFSPAISFVVSCDSQEEIDRLWDALSAGGSVQQCGWLTDRYGVTWQIVPARFFELVKSGDTAQTKRVMDAMMEMVKFDIEALEKAAAG